MTRRAPGASAGPRPPAFARLLLERAAPPALRDALLGDLEEELADRVASGRSGRAWYARQVLASVPGLLAHRLRRSRAPEPPRASAMSTFLQDLRYALRTLRQRPGFSAVVVLTLGLGIGANAMIFGVVDGVVLNPFPFPEPERLVGVGSAHPRLSGELGFWENLSPAEYLDIAGQSRALERVVAWDMGNRQVTFGDATENLFSGFWWGDAFPTLEMPPVHGRGFLPEEIERGERVAILSHRVWQTRLGADPGAVGRTILMNGEPYTVVGIMPPRALLYGMDLWLPMGADPSVFPRGRRQFQVLARLAPGASLERAEAELATIAGRVEAEHLAEHPEYEGWRLVPRTWNEINVSLLRPAALILLAAVGFVLLLVCANVASLLLGRAATRRREMAVRTALGAGRGRIVRQLLTESVALGIVGGLLGLGLGWLALRGVSGILAGLALPIPGEPALSVRVLLATAAASVGAGVLFGLAPAVQALRTDLRGALHADAGAATASAGRLRLQRALVGVEVALALVLLAGGGLLANSLLRLGRVDPGVDTGSVLTMRLTLPWERHDAESIDAFFSELLRRVEGLPGVRTAAVTSQFPPSVFLQRQFSLEGEAEGAEGTLPTGYATVVSPDYFRAMGIPLLRGRALTAQDRIDSPPVIVMNEVAARRFFPGADPLGRRVKLGGPDDDGPWREVVGIVAATRNRGLDAEPAPELYASARQITGFNQLFLVVRTEVDPRGILPGVRREVAAIDPDQPVYAVRTLEEAFASASATRRLSTVSLTLFALFAVILAAVGIYGVVAFATAQRTREIGIRLALGAARGQVRALVVRQAALPVAIGAAVGILGAVAVGRLMAGMLFQVSGHDPATLVGVTAVMLGVALVASWLPARRATRLDPVEALRSEGTGR